MPAPMAAVMSDGDVRELRRIGSLRAYQTERLALWSYRHLLSVQALLERFRDDASVDAFWAMSDDDRGPIWGPPFDLTKAEQEHDRPWKIVGPGDRSTRFGAQVCQLVCQSAADAPNRRRRNGSFLSNQW
ncbi:MAG TPA: hypothetical protein VKE51_18715 [Vicinamibacterales bacterium]|nr:hypothetical protein [Vicinamibacterales bacterium]